ncbi:MAG: hypothetical protein AAB547_03025 [Patescibacteria group bacterium]
MRAEIQKFLGMTTGSTEPCLMIAHDEQELVVLEQAVSDFGLQKTKNVRELFDGIRTGSKIYFTLGNTLGNNIYNILTQYPTGQVTAYDGQKNLVANPDYQKGSMLILITKANLKTIEQAGKSLLRLAGVTWQKRA